MIFARWADSGAVVVLAAAMVLSAPGTMATAAVGGPGEPAAATAVESLAPAPPPPATPGDEGAPSTGADPADDATAPPPAPTPEPGSGADDEPSGQEPRGQELTEEVAPGQELTEEVAPAQEDPAQEPRVPGVVSVPVRDGDLAAGELVHEGTPFKLVAMTWDDPHDEVTIQVSVREDGVWGGWIALEADEHGDGRGGTVPLTTGGLGDGVRLRVDPLTLLPAGARLELVDPGEDTPSPRAARAAASAAPSIISRAQWGADESINTHTPSPARYLEMAFVHHTATTNSYGPGEAAAQVRSIYLYHVQGRGWGDIGYNFIVDQYGQVFEGRSGGIEVPEIGAHAGSGFNTGSVGVAALGTFDSSVPTVVPERISQLIAWKFGLHGIDPHATVARTSGGAGNVRWSEGTQVWLPAISGHRHSSFTACPGEALFAYLPAIRDRVAGLLAEAGTVSWLAGTFDGVRVERDRVTVYGWAASTEGVGNIWVRARTGGRTASAPVGLARPDVAAAYPAYGPRTGYEATLSLPSGSHQVCLDVYVPGRPMVTIGCRWAAVTAGRMMGNLEAVTPQRSAVRVAGWLLQSGMDRPNDIHVYVDGGWGGSYPASGIRPDVAAAYPAEGAAHGFDVQVSVPGGRHTVCVYGISLASAIANPLLGCRTVDVPTGQPVGHLEAAQITGDAVRLVGWTFDPDGADPLEVHVYRNGTWAGRFVADAPRADVQRAYGLPRAAHGLDVSVALPLGRQEFCAYAINVGPPATNPLIGCRTVGEPLGMPTGSFDSVTRTGPGTARVTGWLVDPDTRGPASVHVYVDGRWGRAGVADRSRPDLVRVLPAFGPNHGFDLEVAVGSGPATVCVYGINVGVGATNPLVACRTVP